MPLSAPGQDQDEDGEDHQRRSADLPRKHGNRGVCRFLPAFGNSDVVRSFRDFGSGAAIRLVSLFGSRGVSHFFHPFEIRAFLLILRSFGFYGIACRLRREKGIFQMPR